MGQRPEKDEKRLSFIKDNGLVQLNELHEKWGVSRTAISNWISKMVREGTIRWCKENGDLFADNNEMNKEKSSGNAYLKVIDNQKQIDTKGLPTVFEITGDDDWDVGGELYKKYDLRLDLRNIKDECSGVQVVTEQCVNTPKTHEPLENTERNDGKELGVQVFSPLSDDKKKEAYIDDIFGFDLST